MPEMLQQSRASFKITIMVLKENIYALINIQQTRLLIALEMNVSEQTVKNWIAAESEQLTLASVLKVIKAQTGLTESELLEDKITA